MTRRRLKVYLPKWMRGVTTGILALMWGFVTYSAFFTAQGKQELGVIGWAVTSVVLGAVGAMIWAMTSGKLPAYIVEEEDDGK